MSTSLQDRFPAPSLDRPDGARLTADRQVVLYHFGPSLCSQKVRMTLKEKGVRWTGYELNLMREENLNPEYMRINPRGVVPTLVDAGYVVFDSATIIRYIDRYFDGPPLAPGDRDLSLCMEHWLEAQDRFPMRELSYGNAPGFVGRMLRRKTHKCIETLEKLAAENPDLAENYAAKVRDTEQWIRDQDSPATVEQINADMTALLGELERQLAQGKWIVGDDFTLADIAWATLLARIAAVGLGEMWAGGKLPKVEAYYARLMARPAFKSEIHHYQRRSALMKRTIQALILGKNVRGAIYNAAAQTGGKGDQVSQA